MFLSKHLESNSVDFGGRADLGRDSYGARPLEGSQIAARKCMLIRLSIDIISFDPKIKINICCIRHSCQGRRKDFFKGGGVVLNVNF